MFIFIQLLLTVEKFENLEKYIPVFSIADLKVQSYYQLVYPFWHSITVNNSIYPFNLIVGANENVCGRNKIGSNL